MKQKNTVSRPKPNGCFKMILLAVLVFLLVLSPCLLFLFVPNFYNSPEVRRIIDKIGWFARIPIPAEKESDLLAFACNSRRRVYGFGRDLYGTDLYTVKPDGSQLRQIHSGQAKIYSQLNWSPDGNWIALEANDDGYWDWNNHLYYESHTSEIYIIRFDGLVSRRLTYNRVWDRYPRWSSDGKSIFFSDRFLSSGWHQQVSASGGEVKQISQQDQVYYGLSPHGFMVRTKQPLRAFSKHDVSFTDLVGELHVYDTKSLVRPFSFLLEKAVRWSPNGKWLAIVSAYYGHSAHGEWITISDDESIGYSYRGHIYLVNVDTGRVDKLITDMQMFSFAWSPDSEWLAFVSNVHNGQLFKIRRDGTSLQQLTDMDCRITDISWSPK